MESFNLVLLVVDLLVGILDSLEALLLIVDFFFLIDTSALHLFLFQFLVSVLDSLGSEVLNGVGPVLYAGT